jgi:sensor histidine kinase YesM
MFKSLYIKHQYFFNLVIVMLLITTTRIMDWLAWMPPYPDKIKNILIQHLIEVIACMPIILALLASYKWAIQNKNKIIFIVFVLVVIFLGPTALLYLKKIITDVLLANKAPIITLDGIIKFSSGGIVYFSFLSLTFYLTHTRIKYNTQRDAAHKAEALAKDLQLKMLRYQINPHFLFNVLNSIHALIDENSGKAKKLVVEMSEYYRYTLNKQHQTISIEKEVESITKYLEIQKTRFEDNFEFEIYVDAEANNISIPSFVIHLLIENAVKYGIKSTQQKLNIKLSVTLSQNLLNISVSNTGKLFNSAQNDDNNGTGNGIENIKNRLALFYNNNYSFSLTENNERVIACIEINTNQPHE